MSQSKIAKNTSYLRRFSTDLDSIAKQEEVSVESVEDLLDHFFVTMKGAVEDERMPKIQITNLGTFKPTTGKINYRVKRWISSYRRGTLAKPDLDMKIKRIWAVKQRLIKEENGENTWKEWKNKKLANA